MDLKEKIHSSVNIHNLYMLEQVVNTHTTRLQTISEDIVRRGNASPFQVFGVPFHPVT